MKFLIISLTLLAYGCAQEPIVRPSFKGKDYSGKDSGDSQKDPVVVPPGDKTDGMKEDPADKAPDAGGETGGEKETPQIDLSLAVPAILPATLAELNIYDKGNVLNAKIPFLKYQVNSALWSDGAAKDRLLLLPKNAKLTAAPFSGNIVFPAGTIFVKQFSSEVDKSVIETRVMLKRTNLTWDFAAYRHTADGTTKRVIAPEIVAANASWPKGYRVPSESECTKCHNPNVIDVLGFRPEQLKGVIEELAAAKVIEAADLETFKKAVPYQGPKNAMLSAEAKARAYLQVNCVQCHQPNGARSSLPLGGKTLDWSILLKAPAMMTGDVLADSPIITPGSPEKSKLYLRFTAMKNRMPGVSVVQDPVGEEALKAWIQSIPVTCTVAAQETCSPK